jgi:hypothetical protein
MSRVPVERPKGKTKKQAVQRAARRLSYWSKKIVQLGPQGAARYLLLDKLRREMNNALRLPADK